MADDGIKTKVGVQGDKEYKTALSDIGRQLRVLNSDMKASQSAFGDQASSMAGLQDKLSKLGSIYDAQKSKVQLIADQLEKAKGKYGENSQQVQSLQIALNSATRQMNDTGNQIKRTERDLNTLADAQAAAGEETITANTTLEEAKAIMNDMAKSTKTLAEGEKSAGDAAKEQGEDAERSAEQNSKLHDALSKVGEVAGGAMVAGLKAAGAALAAVTAAAGAALAASYEFAKGAGQYADDVGTLSVQTGISADALQRWTYNANFIDTSVDTITGSMTKMIRNMDSAASGSKTAAASFAALDVDILNVNGRLRGTEDVFWDAIDALGQISNETERDALAMELFGKSAKELNPLIEAGSAAWKQMGQEAEAMGTVFSQENLDKMGAFDDSMQRFSQTGQALKNSIGLVMIPAFQPLVDAASESMGKVAKALQDGVSPEEIPALMDDLVGTLGNALDDVLGMVVQSMPLVGDALTKAIGALAQRLPALAKSLLPAAMGLLKSVVGAIKTNIGPITELATSLVTSLAGFLTENLPELSEAALELVGGLVDGLIDALPELIPAGVEMLVKLGEGLLEGIPELVGKLPQVLKAVWDGIVATDWGQLGMEILGSILSGLGAIGQSILGLLGVPGEGEQSGITAAWETFAGTVKTSITDVLESVTTFLGLLFNPPAEGDQATQTQQWGTFAETLKSTIETGLTGAAELISGIFTGGKAAVEAFPWDDTGTKLGTMAGKFSAFALDGLSGVFDAGKAAVAAFPWVDVGTRLGELGGQIANVAIDGLSGVFDAGNAAIAAFPWDDIGTKLGTLAGQATAIRLDALSGVFDAASAAVAAFPWDDIGTKLGTLAGQATAIPLDALSGVFIAADSAINRINWTGLGESVGILVDGVTGIAQDSLSGIFTSADTVIRSINWAELGNQIADGLSRAWGVLAGVGDVALGVGESVVNAGQQGVGALKDWIASWRSDPGAESEAQKAGQQVVTDLNSGVEKETPTLELTAETAANALLTAVQGILTTETVQAIGYGFVTDLGSGISQTDEATTAAANLATAALDALREGAGNRFVTLGQNIAMGVAVGISSGSGAIRSAARQAARTAYEEAKVALDIHSPSKVMEQIGAYFDEGFVGGIRRGEDEIRRAVGELSTAAVNEASGRVTMMGAGGTSAMQGIDYDAIKQVMVEAIRETGAGRAVITMNGRVVGETTEPYTNQAAYQRSMRTISGRSGMVMVGR